MLLAQVAVEGDWGALAAFPFSKARDPIPGTAQTLLAALTWAHQGAELCLCVFQSQLSGDKRDGMKLPGKSCSLNKNTWLIQQGIAQPRAINNA